MLDYLKKCGCVPLSDAPFNDADRLVLAQAAYLNFPGGLPSGTPLKEALTGVSFLPDEPSETRFGFQHKDDIALRDLMIASIRYREMRFAGANRCLTPEGQFAVFSILLPDDTLVVSFRGTDNTLAGWKEDCDLSYKEEIPAQRMAREYVEEMAASAPRIELLGHSKGGNLALYAAATGGDFVQNRLVRATSFDGPGLSYKMTQSEGYRRVQDRLYLCIPRASLVGLLFHQPANVRTVESRTFSILQHYPYTWRTKGMDLVNAERLSIPGRKLGQTVRGMLERLAPETRRQFVEAVYGIIAASGAETLNDLVRGWIANTPAITRKLLETDRDTYRLLLKILIAFWASAAEALGVPVRLPEKEDL